MIKFSVFAAFAASTLFFAHYIIIESAVSLYGITDPAILQTLWIAAIALTLSFPVASVLSMQKNSLFTRVLYKASVVWLSFLNYLVIAACVYALIVGVWSLADWEVPTALLQILLPLISIGVTIGGIMHASCIKVRRVELSWPNLPAFWHGKKAVWVSDIHLGQVRGARFAAKVVAHVSDLSPDIVFVGGDLYDGVAVDEAGAAAAFSALKPPLGSYFITGNHEEFRDSAHFVEAVKAAGIRVLHDEMVDIQGMQIIGVYDHDSMNKPLFSTILSGLKLDRAKPSILLKHRPSGLDLAAAAGITLQISGHTHKAQAWPFALIGRLIYGRFIYGMNGYAAKDGSKMQVYTSSGVGTWGPPMRVGSDSEIVEFVFR